MSQKWMFSLHCPLRTAVVGSASPATVEEAMRRAGLPEDARAEIRRLAVVRDFVEGRLDPSRRGYYDYVEGCSVCVGAVHAVVA